MAISKRFHTTVAALAIAVGSIAPAASANEEIDISTLTCTQLSAMPEDAAGFVLIWIEGYLGGRAEDTVFNLERLKANTAEVQRACAQSPVRSVLDIIEKYEASQVETE